MTIRVGARVSWVSQGRGAKYPRKGVVVDVRYNRLGQHKCCVEVEQPDGSVRLFYPSTASLKVIRK